VKVILIESVERVGSAGDVVDVARGYAQNYLIPRQLAVPATSGNLKVWEQKKQAVAKKEEKATGEARQVAEELERRPLVIASKAGEQGKLFGSVTSGDISQALLQATGREIDKKKILLEENIKALGNYTVAIRLHPEVEARVQLQVVEAKEE
jgi:large subunit ribosomal protein L9